MRIQPRLIVATLCCAPLPALAGGLGVVDGKLAPCPSAPHCVSSQSTDAAHAVAPLAFTGDPAAAWKRLKEVVTGFPRLAIVEEKDGYLRLVATTRIMRFKDDVEFLLPPGASAIEVRSCSRIGYYDMKANRKRVEAIRRRLPPPAAAVLSRP